MSIKTDKLIEVKDLEKSFGEVNALNGITTDIHRGEVVVVVGPSGSGKSTFLRCLNLLEKPTKGSVIFEGVDLSDPKTDIDRLRQKMGMVFQHFNLFPHMTILKNMTIAPMKLQKKTAQQAEDLAMQLLHKVGLAERSTAFPSQLSGGQKQRIAIVRALCMQPDVMLFDEPTSALDKKSIENFKALVKNLKANKIIIIIT
ncbi:MAG: amino acid ABC transporter ATP-binding protein, partial [Oscillospiraceae bacterium]